jgi:hypothetical protein
MAPRNSIKVAIIILKMPHNVCVCDVAGMDGNLPSLHFGGRSEKGTIDLPDYYPNCPT